MGFTFSPQLRIVLNGQSASMVVDGATMRLIVLAVPTPALGPAKVYPRQTGVLA
jgi:hypothetical protein